jgi:hypothetical protein
MVEAPPRRKTEATNRVAEEVERSEGGPGTSSHGLDVGFPRQFGVEEESEVSDALGEFDFDLTCKGVAVHNVGGGRAEEGRVGADWEEDHGFRFVGVGFEAVASEPGCNFFQAFNDRLEG